VILVDPSGNRILWQYGRTDVPGAGADQLAYPDGIDQLPVGVIPAG